MFEIEDPWVLIAIFIPWLIWFLVKASKLYLPSALNVPFFNAIAGKINEGSAKNLSSSSFILLSGVWVLIIIALSGPRWVGNPIPLIQEGRNIMLVLDLSGSMEMDDMILNGRRTTRLNVVKQTAEKFISERQGDRVGLILFGTQAYLQTPLTFDRHNVLLRIADATVGLAGKSTSIGDALGLAVKRLQDVPAKSRVVILLTDGVNNSGVMTPLKAAELAKDDNIKVYTIGLGADTDPYNDPFFNAQAAMDLDEDTLKEIALMTQGNYFRATDPGSLANIYKTINQFEPVNQDSRSIIPQKEYYPWPLGLGLLLLFSWLFCKTNLYFSLRKLLKRSLV